MDKTNPALNIHVYLLAVMLALTPLAGNSQENASNPLAAVNNTDVRLKAFDLGDADLNEAIIEGAAMLNPKLKLKYELHWWETDISGEDESDWESASIKLIYFPKEGKLKKRGNPYRLALGFDWIVDLGPEGGSGGGEIIATGSPETIAQQKHSFTGQFLGPVLKG